MKEWRYIANILGLGSGCRRVARFTPLPLYASGKRFRYPMDRRFGGPRGDLDPVKREKSLSFAGNRTPVVEIVAVPAYLLFS
jgi:hypothetical protein